MTKDQYTLKWTFDNNFNLVFVAVYFSMKKLLHIDDFLEMVKQNFVNEFKDILQQGLSFVFFCFFGIYHRTEAQTQIIKIRTICMPTI